jgi:hypothetical protein
MPILVYLLLHSSSLVTSDPAELAELVEFAGADHEYTLDEFGDDPGDQLQLDTV